MTLTYDLVPDQRPSRDFVAIYHGSVVTFTPLTQRGRDWWSDNVQNGPAFGNAYAVDPRLAEGIFIAIRNDCLDI